MSQYQNLRVTRELTEEEVLELDDPYNDDDEIIEIEDDDSVGEVSNADSYFDIPGTGNDAIN